MRAHDFIKFNTLSEFVDSNNDDSGGDEVFVLAPNPDDRLKFKVRIIDPKTHEEFAAIWNRLHPAFHKFFDNEYPFWNSMHPKFAKLPVVDMDTEQYIWRVSSAIIKNLANAKMPGQVFGQNER
jgi:hypothetical protein